MSPAFSILMTFGALACLALGGVGSYRAFRYGERGQKALGAIAPILLLLGLVFVPVIVGVMNGLAVGAGKPPLPTTEWIRWFQIGTEILAAVVGYVLLKRFPKPSL